MEQNKFDIYVFADWQGMTTPKFMGTLSAHFAKGKKAFSFEYDKNWINTEEQILLDPDIQFYSGKQFSLKNENFGLFLDSMPDTWGRKLMKRRAILDAKQKSEKAPNLYDIDFLLRVYDESRMGALRFKTDFEGPFLDNNRDFATPPWSSIRELQNAANHLESDGDSKQTNQWLDMLLAPGSSLGGARPKANILDEAHELWIAKFPSKNDTTDKAAWEFLAYKLALDANIEMYPCKIEKIAGNYHTFFTKRFDRFKQERIHFASAMTMTGNNEESIKEKTVSYLDLADFIQTNCIQVDENLHQLWTRIVFNIAISNTDDHLRNHGFILTNRGWTLSPAFDINPSTDKNGLALNIDLDNNALDFELAFSVGNYFRLNKMQMEEILANVINSVKNWRKVAKNIGISRSEQELMESAFTL